MSELEVRHQESSTASGLLLAGWLASRLGWEQTRVDHARDGDLVGSVRPRRRTVTVRLRPRPSARRGWAA